MDDVLDHVGEKIEFPKFTDKNDFLNEKMRIYLAKLISEEAKIKENNEIVRDYTDKIKLARNYIDACEAAYLKINETSLEEYNKKYNSNKWEVKETNRMIEDEWNSTD